MMTEVLDVNVFCFYCGKMAIWRCDFRKTAYDRCGRPCCVAHGGTAKDGHGVEAMGAHLCQEHRQKMEAIFSNQKKPDPSPNTALAAE